MDGFFDGLEQSIKSRNWNAALVMALTLPDICATVVAPTGKVGRRYAAWFDEHLKPTYTSVVNGQQHVFLSGKDCYVLRCALLHEGSADVATQPARDVLDRFQFCAPGTRRNSWHRNQVDTTLILMVDEFATDVLHAARSWWATLPDEKRAAAKQRQLTIIDSDLITGI
ncbi:hypothetical protein [Streptomyces umbrinus]|uniref:hypothetical protein n=1 Tax=Streptomyces umbrinus TaxID=67370 RepID=UPI003C2C1C40